MARRLLWSTEPQSMLWLFLAQGSAEVDRIDALFGRIGELSAAMANLEGACALDAYRRLRTVLDGVTAAELEEAIERVGALDRSLGELARALDRLRRLKEQADGWPPTRG